MAPEQAPREGVAESLSLDNKTGNPPLLEGLLSQTSSPDWLFLPSGISLALGQWMALMETLTFPVCLAGVVVKPLCPSPPWLCPCPFPILGTGLEGGSGKVPGLPAPWKGMLLGWGAVALLPGQKDGDLHLPASRRGITAAILAGLLLLS